MNFSKVSDSDESSDIDLYFLQDPGSLDLKMANF